MAEQYRAARYREPHYLSRERDNALSLSTTKDGVPAVVASGAITIRSEDGALIVDADSVGVGGSGEATYALLAALLPEDLAYSCKWSADWDLVFADGARLFSRAAFLLRRPLHPTIDGEDMVGETGRHPELSADQVLTVAQAHPFAVQAWGDINGWLIADGHPPQKVLAAESLGEMHNDWACHRMFAHLATYATGAAGRYASERDRYGKEAMNKYGRLKLPQDADQDGTADGTVDSLPALYGVMANFRGLDAA